MLERVSLGIKTFIRDRHLSNTIETVTRTLPEVQMIIADDGYETDFKNEVYEYLECSYIYESQKHKVIKLPFDSGFGKKSNNIVQSFQREYLLIGSDDFDFDPPSVREGIIKLVEVLDKCPEISIASGRVWNRAYEFDLVDLGDTILEKPVVIPNHIAPWFIECDLTVNYSLIRRQVFDKVGWDDEAKIGEGEHGAFFVDCMRKGFRTCYVPGVNINEQQISTPWEYLKYRSRASAVSRSCFDKRGIRKYVLGNGQVDYDIIGRS